MNQTSDNDGDNSSDDSTASSNIAAIVVSIVSFLGTLIVGLVVAWYTNRNEQWRAAQERQQADEEETFLYREQLHHAAFELQGQLRKHLIGGGTSYFRTPASVPDDVDIEKGKRTYLYHLNNMVYLLGQYFAWTEKIRSEIGSIRLAPEKKRELMLKLHWVQREFFRDDLSCTRFRLYLGEQRLLGQSFLSSDGNVISHKSFVQSRINLQSQQREERDTVTVAHDGHHIVDYLLDDTRNLDKDLSEARYRLTKIQNALADLTDHLDPGSERFPTSKPVKVPFERPEHPGTFISSSESTPLLADTVEFTRNPNLRYDFRLHNITVAEANSYKTGRRRFRLHVKIKEGNDRTPVMLRLENSRKVARHLDPQDYSGIHSRYEALVKEVKTDEVLEFWFIDSPDDTVSDNEVDTIRVRFDPGKSTSGIIEYSKLYSVSYEH